MFKKIISLLLITAIGFGFAQKYETGLEVMQAFDAKEQPKSTIATTKMLITSGSGQSLSREMQMWSSGDSQIIKFLAPADIKGSGFLSITQDDGSSEAMIYLPALDRIRRISSDKKDGSFFGSDFSYEDIDFAANDINDSNYKILDFSDGVYQIKAVPHDDSDSLYDKRVLYINEEKLIPEKIEYYIDGELAKLMTIVETKEVSGYTIFTSLKMETLDSESFTTIEQSDIELDKDIPAEVFSERFLRK